MFTSAAYSVSEMKSYPVFWLSSTGGALGDLPPPPLKFGPKTIEKFA